MKEFVFLFVCCFLFETVFAQSNPSIPENDRIRIAEAFRLNDKISEKVWKDLSRTPFAVLLVTPENEFLIRHPAPSDDFQEIGYDKLLKSKVYWRKRVFNPSFLATFPAIGGISTVVVGQAENTSVKASTPWVVTLLHEHFHQFQTTQKSYYDEVNALGLANGDTSGMWMLNYAFPYSTQDVVEKSELLGNLLANVLETSDKTVSDKNLKTYLNARQGFQIVLKANDYKYFSFQLWQEGIARYVEYKIALMAAQKYKPTNEFRQLKDFQPFEEVEKNLLKGILAGLKTVNLTKRLRVAFYSIGAGEGLLLDKVNPNWKSNYHSERFYLEKYLETGKRDK